MSAVSIGGFPEPFRDVVNTTGRSRDCGVSEYASDGEPHGFRTSWLVVRNVGGAAVRLYFRKAAFLADAGLTLTNGFVRLPAGGGALSTYEGPAQVGTYYLRAESGTSEINAIEYAGR